MTDLDALDRAFLKGSGVPSGPNKGNITEADPLDAAFMRGLEQTPMAEVASPSMEAPYTPTSMAGAVIRGFGGGLAQGARDIGVTAGKAIVGVPEAVVGLSDIVDAPRQALFSKLSTGRVQIGLVGKMLENIGVDFKTTQDFLSTLYSDEQKRALQNVSDKKSVGGKLVALGANPTVPIHSILQSLPSMMLAASASAPLAKSGMVEWLAGALGEGIVQSGSAQEQTRQQSDTGYTTPKQTALAVASGLVDAAISAASGKISKRIGLEDVESIGASGSSSGSNLGFWRKLVGGMFMEGPVEEGLQSAQEKIAENLALGRPWDEDVKGAFTEGSVSGAVMGAGANALPSKGRSKSAPPLDADAWIKENADMLPTIAAKEKLGRKYWETLGLPRVDEVVRDEFLQKVKDTVAEPKFPEPGSVVPPSEKTEEKPVLPLNEETEARRQKVLAEVQAELDAQTAEEDADEAAYALFGKREAKTPVPDATATPVEPDAPVPTDTAAEVVKTVEDPVAAEAKAVEERKKGKRVPKAPNPVNKGKGVVEPVVVSQATSNVDEISDDVLVMAKSVADGNMSISAITKESRPDIERLVPLVKELDITKGSSVSSSAEYLRTQLTRKAQSPVATEVAITDTAKAKKQGKKVKPKTIEEADANIAEQKAVSEFVSSLKEESVQKAQKDSRRKFVEDNTTSHAESVMLRDMISGGYEKALEDIESGRVSEIRADALAQLALDAGFTDQFNRNRFKAKAVVKESSATEKAKETANGIRERHALERKSLEEKFYAKELELKEQVRKVKSNKPKRIEAENQWIEAKNTFREEMAELGKRQYDELSSNESIQSESKARTEKWNEGREARQASEDAMAKDSRSSDWNKIQDQGGVDAFISAREKEISNYESLLSRTKDYNKRDNYSSLIASRKRSIETAKTLQGEFGTKDISHSDERKQGKKVASPTVKDSLSVQAPAPAPVKVETEKNGNKTISVPKADKPSTTPAMQRAYLEAEIDKAMESAPAESDAIKETRKIAENEYESSSARENAKHILRYEPKVTIEVPNDGTYSIFNTKEALSELKKRVPKMFPDKAPKANMKPSLRVNTGRISAEQVSMSTPEVIAQYKIQLENGIYSDADTKTIREGIARAERSSAIKKETRDKIAAEVAKAEGYDIELVDTVSDLPADVRSQLRPDTSNIEGLYVNGKTYIIGENVTADRAEAVVREEMAHRKLDTAQGEELIDGFKKRMTEKDRKALIKEGYTKTRGESDADYEARLANEFIAKQARKNTSAWTEFVDSVKSFLESVGVRDLTSEEAARVILRKLRGGVATGKGVRYSLRDQDSAYMDAVNSGDEATAQKMVDEAAKRAGRTVVKGFRVDRTVGTDWGPRLGTYYGSDKSVVRRLGDGVVSEKTLLLRRPFVMQAANSEFPEAFNTTDINSQLESAGVSFRFEEGVEDDAFQHVNDGGKKFVDALRRSGYDSLQFPEAIGNSVMTTTLVFDQKERQGNDSRRAGQLSQVDSQSSRSGGDGVLYGTQQDQGRVDTGGQRGLIANGGAFYEGDSEAGGAVRDDRRQDGGRRFVPARKGVSPEIESADAVTRDDDGNVIPLSERFNEKSDDIRYSLSPAAELDEAKYESAKGIFGAKLERVGEAEFRKWVAEKLPDSAMPYAERFLSERSANRSMHNPTKRTTSLMRRISEPERAALNLDTETRGGQGTWKESVARAASTVKANESAGDELISELVDNPRPLTQDEIALLLRAKTQRWNARDAAMKTKDRAKIDTAQKRLLEAYFVSDLGPDKSISVMGAALNALKMMNNEKYELINMTQEMYAITGDISKPGSQAYKDLEAIAQQYKERTEVLERENTRLQEEATAMNQSLADALAQAAYNQGKPKSKGKSKASKIASVADLISKKSKEYGASLIEQARKEQAELNMRASSGVDPMRVLMLAKFAAGHIMMGVSDVAAKVSEFYGSKITSAEMAQIMSEANKIATDATSRIAKEAESEYLGSRVIAKGKGAKTATQLSEVSLKDMFREQAENGVKTFKEALPLVGKLVRASGINATDAQIRDVYDSYIKEPGVLSTDEIKKIIAGYRQEAQLLSKISDAERGVRPHKIGAPRFPSSQEARTYQKELDDLMKTTTFSDGKKGTDIASPLDAKKTWMQNEIDDMEKAIAFHEKRFQGEKGITDQGDIEYQRLKAQLEDVRKRYAEAFPKKPLTQEEQLAILIKQEEKNVDRWNKRVTDAKSGKFKSYERVQRPYSERLAELQYQRDNAKAEVARLYELQNPGKRAREAQMKRDLAAIKEMERRMAAGDYTTRQTKEIDISGDPDAMAAHVAREQTKKTYEQYKARAAWNKLSKARRIAELAKNVFMSDKAIVYSGDNSFVGRQGWFFAMTHMLEWAKSTGKGLTALDTAKSATMVQEIKESDLFKSGVYKAAGININVKDATGNFSTTDDVNLNVADKIPVLGKVAKVSGRLFGADANLMRTNFLRVVLEGSETGRKILANPYELTEKQKDFLKHVGWGVNVFTGFSNNETIKAGVLLGAPNWCLSVLENMTQAPVLNALLNGDFDAAWQLEKQYGRFYLATAALMAALSMLPSGPKDDEGKRKRKKVIIDPRSNRFGIGYIPYTDIAFQTTGPFAPWIRFMARNISGQKVSGGRATNLRKTWLFFATDEEKAQAVPYKEGQMMDNLNFLRSKFRPLVSAAIGFQTGTDFFGNEVPRSRVLVEAVSPLAPLHFIDNLVRVSPEQAAFESFMEAFGVDSKPDFNSPEYKKYEAKMKVVDEMFKLKFKGENGKSFGDRAEDIYIANAMKTLHGATDTDSSPGSQESAKMMIDDLGLDACLMLLEYQTLDERRQRSGGKISTEPLSETTSLGELSAYGKRVQKLRIISAQ